MNGATFASQFMQNRPPPMDYTRHSHYLWASSYVYNCYSTRIQKRSKTVVSQYTVFDVIITAVEHVHVTPSFQG
jgi:hypothetical protein